MSRNTARRSGGATAKRLRRRPRSQETHIYYRNVANTPRVAITGIGVVSAFGVGRDTFWDNISRGRTGTRAMHELDLAHSACRVAAPVPDEGLGGDDEPRRAAKVSKIAVLAAR